MRPGVAVCVVFVFGAGCITGARFQPDPSPEFIRIPHTIVKHEVKTKVVHKGFNDACRQALGYADKLNHAIESYDGTSTEQLDLLSRARQAIVAGDLNETSRVITDQNALEGNTVGYIKVISENLHSYEFAKKECEAEHGSSHTN